MGSGLVRVLILVALLVLLATEYSDILRQAREALATETSDIKHNEQTPSIGRKSKNQLVATMKNSCLPKLICELNAAPHKEQLSESEKALLSLISDTTISTTAEVTSRYHFAAHMGQLIAGVDSNGCHNFYPSCPFPGLQVLSILKKVRW
ncbi:geko [Lycorma delicatula]|uniref:geko n=1 Tax=Lycorma delicatula TaxID=130591 RepID=UPI003F510DCD